MNNDEMSLSIYIGRIWEKLQSEIPQDELEFSRLTAQELLEIHAILINCKEIAQKSFSLSIKMHKHVD